ncbi:MAG: aldose 1-epimerase family protein [Clostridia bacterium]|nr:aldose 1-epimerase family protein [Clostridia bacterium]
MIHSIENSQLKISVNTMGAQLWSVYSKQTDTEYLWQGDPAFWGGRAYNLFPFIGRMYEGKFRYADEEYPSRCHGLARYFEFVLESQTENKLVFLFTDNAETKKEYPFAFEFRVAFILEGAKLTTEYSVVNKDSRELICAFGGHPGVNVPFGKGAFEEYYVEFSQPTSARKLSLAEPSKLMAGTSEPFALEGGVKLPLRHDLFDQDAIVLENTSGEVCIKCDKESRFVSVRYEQFPFIGFWHADHKPAPYVCIEPWSALPSVDGILTELESKPNMTHVAPNQTKTISFCLEIHE